MSKKKRKVYNKSQAKTKSKNSLLAFKRRSLVKLGMVIALSIPAYMTLSAYSKNQDVERDLNVIGKGIPTLIQVHDESCPSCRQLRSSVNAVIDEFPEIQYKIADLNSPEGFKFASRHQVQKITLMYFDAKGKKLDVVSNLQSKDEVRSFIKHVNQTGVN